MLFQHPVKTVREEGVATLILNNPPVNALNQKVLTELEEAMDALKSDDTVKAILLTSEGTQAFIAGADIRELIKISSAKQAEALARKGQLLFDKIERMPKPVIAAIHAPCLGGGNELVMACHIRIAGERARFGQPEINLGIVPGFGGSQRLLRIVGPSKATEMILTGDMISAQEAFRIGLVNAVVPDEDLARHAKGLAQRIASKSLPAISQILSLIESGRHLSLDEALKREAEAFGKICETEDMKEGISAFLEKRQPQFKNR